MTQIAVGKLLPNLKVTLGNDAAESDSDEKDCESPVKDSSNPDDNPSVQIVRSWMDTLQNPKVYKNKTGGFTTGLDLLSEDNVEMLGKRAERFGLEKEESSFPLNISSLYESMGITIEDRQSAKMKNVRLDALHMRGVNELNTNEIFQYFIEYGPSSVEWINDFSCNVVWLDESSCARALLGVSKPLSQCKSDTVEDGALSDSDDSVKDNEWRSPLLVDEKKDVKMDTGGDPQGKPESPESPVSLDIPIPPGHWRLGIPHSKTKTILLRFATKDDKKLPGAEKRSDYYKKYGNPNYGGLRGLISASRKRKMQAASNRQVIEKGSSKSKDDDSQSSETLQTYESLPNVKPKRPRMRMYADDEELRARKPRPSRDFNEKHRSVHCRLGSKYTRDDLCHLGNYNRSSERIRSDSDEDYDLDYVSSFPRNNKRELLRNDRKGNWPSENQVDLRTKLKQLRSSNVNKHRSPMCIGSEDIPKD